MAAIDDAIRVHTSLAQQQDKKFVGAAAKLAGGPPALQMTFQPRTKVLDLVTGQIGVVIDGYRQNVLTPAANSDRDGSGESATE
jgi:hypothetical protein